MSKQDNIKVAKNVLKVEGEAVLSLIERINENFDEGINAIRNCGGRVIVTGMGKSGLISQKIAATLSSTGTPSLFMHPGEASHGDLGMVTKGDWDIVTSQSQLFSPAFGGIQCDPSRQPLLTAGKGLQNHEKSLKMT